MPSQKLYFPVIAYAMEPEWYISDYSTHDSILDLLSIILPLPVLYEYIPTALTEAIIA